jgi:transposase InsO family protein
LYYNQEKKDEPRSYYVSAEKEVFLEPRRLRVMEILSSWFEDYNENHPHKGLKMKSPREHRRAADKLERWGMTGGAPEGSCKTRTFGLV